MWKYVIKRILYLIPVFIVVSFLVYWLMTFTGDPAAAVAGEYMTQEEIEQLRESMGLNDPIFVRYGNYMSNLLHGDFGKSLYGKDVLREFKQSFPNTIELAVAAMIVTTVIAIPLGIIAAIKQNTIIDSALSAIAMIGISVPTFWLGLELIVVFAVKLHWLPTYGNTMGLKSVIMPAFTAGLSNASLVCRMTRSSMVDNLRADFLRTARAKGVAEKRVYLKHALGNALVPIVTILGSQFSILVGGTVAVEGVFAWPGVGSVVTSAIRSFDYNVVTGNVVIITVFVALILLAVDILYAFVDPRVKARYAGK